MQRRRSPRTSRLPFLLPVALLLLGGCGGGGGGGGGSATAPVPQDQPPPVQWEVLPLRTLQVGGLTSPQLATAVAADGRAHLFFFEDGANPAAPYALTHVALDPAADAAGDPSTVVELDNCSGLAPAATVGGGLLVGYQGGVHRECGNRRQSDAMLSLSDDGDSGWQEATAAIGEVERNPVFFDGLAGTSLDTATDSSGRVHAVFQFFYEGCDAMNFAYPDLRYASAEPGDLDPVQGLLEETVEGNDYEVTNEQNRVGDQVCLSLDRDDRPVVFYSATLADGSHGLRVARRGDAGWEREWVETDCTVGAVSCATSPADGSVAVAYQVTSYSDGSDEVDCLRFADHGQGGWQPRMVDERSRCGEHCSLAFDPSGEPQIAYRSALSHSGRELGDLKLARRSAGAWSTEAAATSGDLGRHNTLWVDSDSGTTFITTYSEDQQTIFLLRR